MSNEKWISVKEAAALLEYNVDYFRREFVNVDPPLVQVLCPPAGPGGRRRRKKVLEADILKLLKAG